MIYLDSMSIAVYMPSRQVMPLQAVYETRQANRQEIVREPVHMGNNQPNER